MTTVLGVAATAAAISLSASAQTASDLQFVSANTELTHALDAKTAKQGDAITARLRNSVRFPDGTEIARGSQLIGHIDAVTGSTQVVFTFDKAQLKDGKQIPVKATVLALVPAGTVDYSGSVKPTADTKVNQTGGSVDLHSAIQSDNSATLESKKNIHLGNGTQLEFALAPAAPATASNGN